MNRTSEMFRRRWRWRIKFKLVAWRARLAHRLMDWWKDWDFFHVPVIFAILVAVVVGAVAIKENSVKAEMRARCLDLGYPTCVVLRMNGQYIGYCVRIENGTEVVKPLVEFDPR